MGEIINELAELAKQGGRTNDLGRAHARVQRRFRAMTEANEQFEIVTKDLHVVKTEPDIANRHRDYFKPFILPTDELATEGQRLITCLYRIFGLNTNNTESNLLVGYQVVVGDNADEIAPPVPASHSVVDSSCIDVAVYSRYGSGQEADLREVERFASFMTELVELQQSASTPAV